MYTALQLLSLGQTEATPADTALRGPCGLQPRAAGTEDEYPGYRRKDSRSFQEEESPLTCSLGHYLNVEKFFLTMC